MTEEERAEIEYVKQRIFDLDNMVYSIQERLHELNVELQERYDSLEYSINASQNQISNDIIDQINETVTRAYENNKSFHEVLQSM